MYKINDDVKNIDKIAIYRNTLMKFLHGLIKGMFLGKVKYPFFVGKKVSISHARNIMVGKNVKFEDYSEIQGLSKKRLIFNDNVTIGRFVMIRPSSYYGVGQIGEGLYIGDNSSVGPFSYIGCAGKIEIGNNVMIGPRVSMYAENHVFFDINRSIKKQGVTNNGIIIEDNCWIGSGVIILDGVTIGSGSVVGAGTIVSKSVGKNTVLYDKKERKTRQR